MSLIDAATDHFRDLDRLSIEVPEWPDENGNPSLIYVQALTCDEMDKITEVAEGDGSGGSMMVYTLIFKAQKEDGTKHFSIGDKDALLRRTSFAVVSRVANEIMATAPSPDDMEKD